ncbi:MAG: tyrosine-type recombinase/integrase [Anaerolineae bacterium]|nr:tyrosine-type recombinase/integrase [Anaerolineae bacterium]
MTGMTFAQVRDRYLNRTMFRSQNTIDAYRRAIDLFLEFLGDPTAMRDLAIAGHPYLGGEQVPLDALSAGDAPIFSQFAGWLSKDKDSADSSVRLRLAGVQRWFQFMDDYGWLPPDFPLSKARRIVRDEFKAAVHDGPKESPPNIEEAIYYYDYLELPPKLQRENVDPERIHRWEVIRLRNRALMHCLAESGGRISEVLSLNIDHFPLRNLERGEVLRVQVEGKGKHRYALRFCYALPAVRDYIEARGADWVTEKKGKTPLFVNHAPRYADRRMSRYSAWHVVNEAAKELHIEHISPHDFRHWRASQLINDGQPLDVVQDYLGHRSVETTRRHYARTDPRRVDDATRDTPLAPPERQ